MDYNDKQMKKQYFYFDADEKNLKISDLEAEIDAISNCEYEFLSNRDLDEDTIWNLLNLKGGSIPSIKLNVENADMYLYCLHNYCALVMIDDHPGEEEACHEPLKGEAPSYIGQTKNRLSPVSFLLCMARNLKILESDAVVGCFLLASSTITNYEDMRDEWKELNVTVKHHLTDIHHDLPTNDYALCSKEPLFSEFINKKRVYGWDFMDLDQEGSIMDMIKNIMIEESLEQTDETASEKPAQDDSTDSEQPSDESQQPTTPQVPPTEDDQRKEELPPVKILEYESDAQAKLDNLVGLDDIKQHIKDMVNLSQYNVKKYELHPNFKIHTVNLHSIFSGPVGVGKTTVAQLYSSLLSDANVLSKGHVVICDRSTFIGNLFGDEEKRVRKVLEIAQGGVLFIDEAYTLVSNHPNDPGRLILPLMLTLLADESQRDIAVVLAGYDKPMENLLSLNPGLASRFANRFHFKPFSIKELIEISRRKNSPYGYVFTKDAKADFKKLVEEAYNSKGDTFSNGRFIANLLEKTYIRHATRCMSKGIFDEDMMKITAADIPEEYTIEEEKTRMGFR